MGSNLVVAARARDRQPENGARGRVDLLVNHVHAKLLAVFLIEPLRTEREEPRGNEMRVALGIVGCGQQVPGDLLADELVVGLVRVERRDHPVAITPCFGKSEIAFLAGAFREARHVEPVPPPALAELRRREQPIHHLFKRSR